MNSSELERAEDASCAAQRAAAGRRRADATTGTPASREAVSGAHSDELAQLRAGVARIEALHRQEYGCCTECSSLYGAPWPCPTIVALEAHQ